MNSSLRSFLRTLIAIGLLLPLVLVGVSAEPVAPPALDVGASERRDLTGTTASVQAQGGNVTAVNIDMLSITRAWQGYYGNITGEITLDDASNNTFYNWSLATSSGEVFATRNESITWTGVNCTNSSQRAAEETYLGQSASDGDSVTLTYNTTDHPAFVVGSDAIPLDSCFSTNAFANNALDTNRFHQILLTDGSPSQNIVYTTLIDSDQTAFNGVTADFQLLVGENEKDGNAGPTTYYFWVELG